MACANDPATIPSPYELHGDGTTYANASADGGYYARICPGGVDPGAVDPAVPATIFWPINGVRCGGAIDGDGWEDTWELQTCSNPIQTGDDDLCPALP